ncbi:MAG TPA: YajG family lipoprotein [Thermoanaerobaculia bacterium]|nr:YajG family lipoprotein [Thermoanaerobaculia bacterium]
MRKFVLAMSILLISVALFAQRKKPDVVVDLKFTPQEGVQVDSLALPLSLLERSVDIRWKDARNQADAFAIGSGTDDDDRSSPIRASTDVLEWVGSSVGVIAGSQGLETKSPADRRLDISLSRFTVRESNKALGSTYSAEIHLAYTLNDAKGRKLTEGAASGTANRYGKSRSGPNMSEVLSDALKDAFNGVLADPNVQASWISGKPSSGAASKSTAAPAETTEEKLKKLDDLLKKGVISKEEHKAARAKILEDL